MLLKILTWNIHKGFSIGNRRLIISEAREAMRATGADVIFLQEVQGEHQVFAKEHPDWPKSAQFEYLADTVWHHHAYGKNAVYDEGHHGNAILSKYPIVSWHNLDLTLHRKEMRGLLHAQIEIPASGKRLHLFNTHINLLHMHRIQQVTKICDYISQNLPHSEQLLLAGDFNDWTTQLTAPLCQKLDMDEIYSHLHGHHGKTFPCFFPVLSLDRMFYRHLKPVQAMVLADGPWRRLSDHLPIYAEIEL